MPHDERTISPASRGEVIAEVARLITLLGVFVWVGWFLVPAHRYTIWHDAEFTGWVAAIANRIGSDQKLYADGLHSPLPPLSFVIVHLLSAGKARWITESFLIYLSQCGTTLCLYLALRSFLSAPLSLISNLAGFFFLIAAPKHLLDDALVQLIVAALALSIARGVLVRQRFSIGIGLTVSLLCAAALLTKQSTGVGALLGILAVFFVFPESSTLKQRALNVGFVLCGTLFSTAALIVLLSPWSVPLRLVRDVFVLGPEPKGGFLGMWLAVKAIAIQLLGLFVIWVGPAACVVRRALLTRATNSATRFGALGRAAKSLLVGGVAVVLYFAVPFKPLPMTWGFPYVALDMLMSLGLAASVFIALRVVIRNARGADAKDEIADPSFRAQRHITALAIFLIASAAGHSLSVRVFRWTYDGNPLTVLALAILALFSDRILRQALSRWSAIIAGRMALALTAALIAGSMALYQRLPILWREVRSSTEHWPEIAYLAGARMPHRGTPIRFLVQWLRSVTEPNDSVLLLPEDPNVQAWFERPRPRLTSAIVFTDQYWARYVPTDLARLAANPPKIVIVGPRNFYEIWSLRVSDSGRGWGGADRLLLDGLRPLLNERYALYGSVQIAHPGVSFVEGTDFLDVYVRADVRLPPLIKN